MTTNTKSAHERTASIDLDKLEIYLTVSKYEGYATTSIKNNDLGALIDLARRSLTSGATINHVAEVKAGKYANRLEWVSDDAMEATPVGTKLYAAPSIATKETP